MTDYKTMRVPEADWEHAKQQKRDGETWGDYLRRCGEESSTTPETVETTVDTEQLESQLDRIEERVKNLSVTENQERVIKRVEDLETELKTVFERELGR